MTPGPPRGLQVFVQGLANKAMSEAEPSDICAADETCRLRPLESLEHVIVGCAQGKGEDVKVEVDAGDRRHHQGLLDGITKASDALGDDLPDAFGQTLF